MSDTGLTLQLEKNFSVLTNAKLLIVTDSSACLQEIEQLFSAISVPFFYRSVSCNVPAQALSECQYDLILYNYSKSKTIADDSHHSHLVSELSWWYSLPSKVPLILITEPLGDETAISCIQSGISGYLLRKNLCQLPNIIKKNLANNLYKQADSSKNLSPEILQLQQELEQLKQKNAELETVEHNINQEYFSHLNHELRSPLANILQFARMLKEEIYGSLNRKQTEYIAGILTSGNHLSDLINDYLDIAKIDADYEELYLEKVPVEDICEASIVMVQGKAKEKELDLVLNIAENVDFCVADSLRLKQILINLLSNAVKFTERGSITLQVTKTAQKLLFSVADTGIGISQENCQKLFKPFQQINTPIHRKHKGTGLGLALSLKLAQLHGGDITLVSQEGKGSCFTVSLPLVIEHQ